MQRAVQETSRTRLSIEIRDWRNDTPNTIGCTDMNYMYTGGLRFGSFKLYVSLKKIGLFCRALLQKRPMILRNLLWIICIMPSLVLESCNAHELCYIGLVCRALLQKRPMILHELYVLLHVLYSRAATHMSFATIKNTVWGGYGQ